MAPWCRIAPYAIGLLIGFIIVNIGRHYPLNHATKTVGTVLAIGFALASIFWNYRESLLLHVLSDTSKIAYQMFSRFFWSVFVSWLIFLCSINQGGIINRILSLPMWLPLARLNYAAYLIHMTIILISVFNQSNPLYYQFLTCLHSFVSQLIFSYLAAILIVILFETPFVVLEKKIFRR